jgi:hypothetical protein
MHPSRYRFPAAPWPPSLRWISALGTLLSLAIAVAAYHAVPTPSGFTHHFGIGVALVPILLLVGCLFSIVRGYTVEGTDLLVGRLFTSTRIPLAGLRRAWYEPTVCKGSLRIFGNGGLYSFTGWFYSQRLGRYRLLATDFSRAVVLVLPRGVVVVTPTDPAAFIEHLRLRFPAVDVSPLAQGLTPHSLPG